MSNALRDMIELNIKQAPLIETCTKECAVMCDAVVWLVRTNFFVVMASPGSPGSSIQHCDSDKLLPIWESLSEQTSIFQ